MRGIIVRQATKLVSGRVISLLSMAAIVAAAALAPPLGNIGAQANLDRVIGRHALRRASGPPLRPYAKLGGASGGAISLSSDGSTALTGNEDSATVYARSGSKWIVQARLEPAGASSGDAFGCSVALSADGDTALIGTPGRSASGSLAATPGAAWVFTRSGSSWVQQATLRLPNEAGSAEPLGCGASSYGDGKGFGGGFGSSLALSGDGSAALVAAPGASRYVGGVWAYIRSDSTWSQDGPTLLAPEATIGALFGARVVLSGDGDTALISAPADIPPRCATTGTSAGGVWTFTRVMGMWK
jgi:FG-GAP repeat